MPRNITPEQFQQYQLQRTQPVADGDVEGQRQKQNAAFWVAHCYYYGQGGVEDGGEEGQQVLERAIQEQDGIDGDNHHDNTGKHRYLLACMVYDDDDPERSSQLYRQAVPRLEVEVRLGGNDENYQETAIHWWKKAAALGHLGAQSSISNHCLEEPHTAKTVSWLQEIAVQNNNTWAQYQLGSCHHHGRGVTKDLVKAVEWYNKAIAQGDTQAHATIFKHTLLRDLSPEERSKTLGCVARNQNIEKATDLIQQSFVGAVPLSLWAHALASFQRQENPPWEAPSPTFLSLCDAIMPQLQKQLKKQEKKNKKRDLQSGNEKPGPFKRSG